MPTSAVPHADQRCPMLTGVAPELIPTGNPRGTVEYNKELLRKDYESFPVKGEMSRRRMDETSSCDAKCIKEYRMKGVPM